MTVTRGALGGTIVRRPFRRLPAGRMNVTVVLATNKVLLPSESSTVALDSLLDMDNGPDRFTLGTDPAVPGAVAI
jgi:hypothetical protein